MDSLPQPLKRCSKCGEEKPATTEFFSPKLEGRYGIHSICKKCRNLQESKRRLLPEVKQADYERNQTAERKVWKKAYMHEYCRTEKYRGWDRSRAAHKTVSPEAKERARQRRLTPEHRAKEKIIKQRFNQSPKGKLLGRMAQHKRRTRNANLPYEFSKEQWERCLDYWDNKCCVCGKHPDFWHILAKEHWIAIADERPDNPGTVAWNILPMCHSMKDGTDGCNNTKSAIDPIQWLTKRLGKAKGKRKLIEIEQYFEWVKSQ